MREHSRLDAGFVMIRVGNEYSSRYVEKLAAAIRRQCSLDLPIHCITDSLEDVSLQGVTPLAAVEGLPGWWQKIALFRRNPLLPRHLVFFDLDVVILQSIDPTLDRFLGRHDLSHALDLVDGLSTSFFLLDTHGAFAHDVYARFDFRRFEEPHPGGDQKYLNGFLMDDRYDVAPLPEVAHYSYKYLIGDRTGYGENRNPRICPTDADRIISLNFHGDPKPHAIEANPEQWPHAAWVLRNW